MKVAVLVPLHEDSSTGKEGCISHDYEGSSNIGKMKYGGSLEFSQKGVKGSLVFRVPGPRLILSCQGSERGDDVRESWDKFVVKVTKTEERSDSLMVLRRGQVAMADSWAGSIQIQPCPTIIPRNSTSDLLNSHFESLSARLRSCNC